MGKIFQHLKSDWYKYAIELIVITFGILGAYGLNSWNEGRKDKASKEYYLGKLLSSLERDSLQLESNIDRNEGVVARLDSALSVGRNPEPGKGAGGANRTHP